LIVEGFLVID